MAEAMEGRLVVMESCAHIPMDEKSEVCKLQYRISLRFMVAKLNPPLEYFECS